MSGPMRGLASFSEKDMVRHLAEEIIVDRWIFSPMLGWAFWTGKVWEPQEDREGLGVMRDFRLYLEQWVESEVLNLPPRQLMALVKCLDIRALGRFEDAVKTVPGIVVPGDWFDRDPMLVNMQNGVLDLLDGSLNPHEPFYGMTKITAAEYVPGATHPDWDQALQALPDEDTRYWVQCYMGRGLKGTQDGVETNIFAKGGGQNGKSLLFGAMLEAVGTYGAIVADNVLAGDAHPEELMDLRALRFGLMEELADGHRINVNRLKKILGTKRMKGRHLFRGTHEWEPSHTLVVTTNYTPVVSETDHGTWRRMLMVPFPTEFPLDPDFKERVYSDPEVQKAVLAWLVEGALQPMPVLPSDAILQATAEWRQATDLIAQFVDECLVADLGGKVPRADMLDRFNDYTGTLGHKPLTGRTFTERFRDHPHVTRMGIGETKTRGVREWTDVSFVAPRIGGRP